MTVITTRIVIAEDGSVSLGARVPAGEYVVSLELVDKPLQQPALEPFDIDKLPVFDLGPWPENLSLRREDLYGDDGR